MPTAQPAVSAVSYRQRLESGVRPYAPEDWPELHSFREQRFGAGSCHADRRWQRWLFEDGPGGEKNPLLLWRDERGRIGGQIGALPVGLQVGGEERDARWLMGLTVAPELRLRGIGGVLPDLALGGCPVALGIEVSDQARASFLRAGWSDLGEAPLLVHPLRPRALLSARRHRRAALALGVPLSAAALAMRLALRAAEALRGAELQPVEALAPHADAIWERCRGAYPLLARRDAAWLGWRFDRFPEPDRYQAHLLRLRGEALGYAVLRLGEHEGIPAAHLVDFLCPPELLRSLVALCVLWVARQPVAALYCLHRNPFGLGCFHALGFLPRRSGLRQMVFAPGLGASDRALLADPASWFLTAAESITDRPRQGTVYG